MKVEIQNNSKAEVSVEYVDQETVSLTVREFESGGVASITLNKWELYQFRQFLTTMDSSMVYPPNESSFWKSLKKKEL